eukprot:scpid111297/ scgid32335/ 
MLLHLDQTIPDIIRGSLLSSRALIDQSVCVHACGGERGGSMVGICMAWVLRIFLVGGIFPVVQFRLDGCCSDPVGDYFPSFANGCAVRLLVLLWSCPCFFHVPAII